MPYFDNELPSFGHDAAGADAFAEVIAASSGNTGYHNISVFCETHDAIVSLDGGTTEHIRVIADQPPQVYSGIWVDAAVHAKNAVGGSNYANLTVHVW